VGEVLEGAAASVDVRLLGCGESWQQLFPGERIRTGVTTKKPRRSGACVRRMFLYLSLAIRS